MSNCFASDHKAALQNAGQILAVRNMPDLLACRIACHELIYSRLNQRFDSLSLASAGGIGDLLDRF